MDNDKNNKIPPIVAQYIQNSFDLNLPAHVRNNYRDIVDYIREICSDAVKEFDRKTLHNRTFKKSK
jgi:hypothetical protein